VQLQGVGAEASEQSVHDVILEMLDEDAKAIGGVKDAVLDALAAVGDTTDTDTGSQAPTYLSSISVAGFRGIGRQARLELQPAPGLTVVSGRNGSGKSSFSEALELALTGTSYRWRQKSSLWAETWRNLHHSDPCAVRVSFIADGVGPFKIGLDWKPNDELDDRKSWTQGPSTDQRADGTSQLGWARPLELWRPILSYDELGRLIEDTPSALYDALDKLLGLDALSDAEKYLTAQLKATKSARDDADAKRKALLAALAEVDDERARRAEVLLRKRPIPLDAVLALATGTEDAGSQIVPTLRDLAVIEVPDLEAIEGAATRLRAAVQAHHSASTTVADTTRKRLDLLSGAVDFHERFGDTDCPVCGVGRLDAGWASRVRADIASSEEELNQYRAADSELKAARANAVQLLGKLSPVDPVAGVELSSLPVFNEAAAAASKAPKPDSELATHLETSFVIVADAADSLRTQAATALEAKEDTWAPLAGRIGAWVESETRAREIDNTVKVMTAAKKWMTDHGTGFRNLRLEPIAAQARNIWSQLRQESNVDLGSITLEGTATKRHAVLQGLVDGHPTKALSVMSQGELHALALALFLPRATAARSPFRFVVLDDPIQAMDPAKIDGFVQVLTEIARTHQVVVFSHDDRLASVIRETGVDARLIEVVRESESRVTVRNNDDPATRQVSDVFALINDDKLPRETRVRVLPGLFRMALETALREAYFTKQAKNGRSRAESEAGWGATKKTRAKLALWLHDDPGADVGGWLDRKPERRRTLRMCNAAHDGADAEVSDARALERTVKEILAS